MNKMLLDPAIGVVEIVNATEAERIKTRFAGRRELAVAVLAVRYGDHGWQETGRSTSPIRPPAFAPVTPVDTAQTGLTGDQLTAAHSPAEALGALDRRFTADTPYLLVAQHAATEANVTGNTVRRSPAGVSPPRSRHRAGLGRCTTRATESCPVARRWEVARPPTFVDRVVLRWCSDVDDQSSMAGTESAPRRNGPATRHLLR